MHPRVLTDHRSNFLFYTLPDPIFSIECLAATTALCKRERVNLSRIELRYANSAGETHALSLAPAPVGETSATQHNVALSARLEHAIGGTMIHVTIANRGDEPIRLDASLFEVATGIAPTAPTRFFKHGYQSWSGSGAVDLATAASRSHPRDSAHFLTRMSHQSESTRTAEFRESATSELFTIVDSPSIAERIMVGFVGAASALTTVTVPTPDKIIARSILDCSKQHGGMIAAAFTGPSGMPPASISSR